MEALTQGREGEYMHGGQRLFHSAFRPEWIPTPAVVLDVGAYDFGDSIRFKMTWPEAAVYGFEMDPDNFGKFSAAAIAAGVEVMNVAIADRDGKAPWWKARHIEGVNAQGSLLRQGQVYKYWFGRIVRQEPAPAETETMTLSTFCASRGIGKIDFLHIDAEGAESKVLRGLGPLRPAYIYAEFLFDGGWDGQEPLLDTERLLEGMGYRILRMLPHDRLYVWEP